MHNHTINRVCRHRAVQSSKEDVQFMKMQKSLLKSLTNFQQIQMRKIRLQELGTTDENAD